MTKEKEVGDEIKVKIKHWNRELVAIGRVKEVTSSYGRKTYVVANAKIPEDFLVRTFED